MRFGSVCSGIEAASQAWNPLGWKAAWFSEIEPFPCDLLAHHYPETPNVGDMTKYKEWLDDESTAIDASTVVGVLTPNYQVRRITPRECERLQGFPDDYTLIPRKGGRMAADSPRYKALGNSWAVPVVRWIGERIMAVEALL